MKKKILLVEDNNLIRYSLMEELGKEYIVLGMQDGAEALDLFEETHVDMVITDLSLPSIDGWRVIEEVNRLRKGMPIVVYTSDTSEDNLRHAADLGVSALILKPMSASEFHRRIHVLFERKDNMGG